MPDNTSHWAERQAAIRELLAAQPIRSQGELIEELRMRGFDSTQSSISRDLTELHAVKVGGRYVLEPPASASSELVEAAPYVRELAAAGPNLLVIKTPAARAALVAVAIDGARWPEVVGTVAGDDTLFLATADRRAQAVVEARLASLVKEHAHAS
ncbi:MAG: arginine repressor [Myxococcales bacterium]